VWRRGTTELLDYGGNGEGPTVLVIPSLINRYYVLDLLPERSFLHHLASSGLRTLVIDWGTPGSEECYFDLTLYIVERLEAAFRRQPNRRGARRHRRVLYGGSSSAWRWRCGRQNQGRLPGVARHPLDFMPRMGGAAPGTCR